MEKTLHIQMAETFGEEGFLRKLAMNRTDLSSRLDAVNWEEILSPLTPITERISCAQALEAFRPVLTGIAPEPDEGWLACAYRTASSLLYPQEGRHCTPAQRDLSLIHI